MFSPVRWREPDGEVTRLLDGAFVANVPAEILRNAEVALIISSDTIPRPHLQDPKRQRLGMVDRFVDLWRGSERVIHDLSSRSARAGEVRFEASLPMIWAVNFRKRKRIEQKAREALEASLFPQRARDAWQMLAKGALRPTEGSSD
jgi:predicted acylesterase/phospholipase RssA